MNSFYPTLPVKRTNPDAPLPRYAHEGDAGMDLVSMEDVTLYPGQWKKVSSGVSCAIPRGFVGLITPRSGLGCSGLVLKNTIGVIDSTYRGEVKLPLFNNNPTNIWHKILWCIVEVKGHATKDGKSYEPDGTIHVSKGDRVAQMLIVPVAEADTVDVDTLDDTERGESGFGSSGVSSITGGPRP